MSRPRRGLWAAVASLVFVAALLAYEAPLYGYDPTAFVLAAYNPATREAPAQSGYDFSAADRRFAVALVSQNARAVFARPLRLFDAEPCHPAKRALAFGHPGLALGFLGAPAWLATGDPVVTYNFAVAATRLLAAFAMFLLVLAWTGIPAAGIAAGLLYAFHVPGDTALTYPFIYDTTWAVFGLFFARRLFAGGGYRDAVALAVCCGLQLSESFYALLGTGLVALPFLVWLFASQGMRRLRRGPALVALGLFALAAIVTFGPFLGHAVAGDLAERRFQVFAAWSNLRPGVVSSGMCFALALVGLVLPRDRSRSDPRWALVVAVALVALVATGGNETARLTALARGEQPPPTLPNLFAMLAAVLPGLDSVRAPAFALTGIHLALSVLAGFGAAALLRRVPARWAHGAAAVLVALAFLDGVRPGFPRVPIEPVIVRPHPEDVAFFEGLEKTGNRGPLFEIPVDVRGLGLGGRGSAISQIVLASYHHRRTSGCYNSYIPPTTRALADLAERLPAPDALATLREQGFTTIVVHHTLAGEALERLDEAARRGDHVRRIRRGRLLTAYEILD